MLGRFVKSYYTCRMNIYVSTVNGIVNDRGFTSLKDICEAIGVPYGTASHGKRRWVRNSLTVDIKKIEVVKIKGRNGSNNLVPAR